MRDEVNQSARLLIVDDEAAMRELMVNYFQQHSLHAMSAAGREEASHHLAQHEPDLVILDMQLDRHDGLDLLRDIRSRSDVPIVVVSGNRCDEIDRVVGLELGADDYVTKPFSLGELLARIRAILRRRAAGGEPPQPDRQGRSCRFNGWQLDRRDRRLTDHNGVRVGLTKSEYALLIAFLDAPRRPLSREYLLQATRLHEDIFDRSIDVQVLRLRRKLESDPGAPRLILTARGVGYLFAASVQRL